jgi:hypothetical protein
MEICNNIMMMVVEHSETSKNNSSVYLNVINFMANEL